MASETCAFDLLGAEVVREIEPGELVLLNDKGVTSYKPFTPMSPAMCVFEYVYFVRPDSKIFGRMRCIALAKPWVGNWRRNRRCLRISSFPSRTPGCLLRSAMPRGGDSVRTWADSESLCRSHLY